MEGVTIFFEFHERRLICLSVINGGIDAHGLSYPPTNANWDIMALRKWYNPPNVIGVRDFIFHSWVEVRIVRV